MASATVADAVQKEGRHRRAARWGPRGTHYGTPTGTDPAVVHARGRLAQREMRKTTDLPAAAAAAAQTKSDVSGGRAVPGNDVAGDGAYHASVTHEEARHRAVGAPLQQAALAQYRQA